MSHLTLDQKTWARILRKEFPKLDEQMIDTIVTTVPAELEDLLEKNNEGRLMGTNPVGGSVCVSEGPETSFPDSKSGKTSSTS